MSLEFSIKSAGIIACILWILSIILAFLIKPDSPYIYVPDAVLLGGFFPLLFAWRYSWPWLIFGLLNLAIGFFLLVLGNLPDQPFPVESVVVKHHLCLYHPWGIWMIMGVCAIAYGLIRLTKNIVLALINYLKHLKAKPKA